jgi:hypothetical protein
MSVRMERTFLIGFQPWGCGSSGAVLTSLPDGRESQTLARDAHERQTRQGRDTSPLSRTLESTWTVRFIGRFSQFADPTGDVERESRSIGTLGCLVPRRGCCCMAPHEEWTGFDSTAVSASEFTCRHLYLSSMMNWVQGGHYSQR